MIKKDELLADLNGFLRLEEDATKELAACYESLTACSLAERRRADIVKDLKRLTIDSDKHARFLKQMIDYIEGSDKDEF